MSAIKNLIMEMCDLIGSHIDKADAIMEDVYGVDSSQYNFYLDNRDSILEYAKSEYNQSK